MAELKIRQEDNLYKVKSEGFYLEFASESVANQKALILFLRSFKKKVNGKHGLFTQRQIAEAMPDFKGATQQSIRDHEKRFEESGKDIQGYLNRKRKVDQEVVEVIAAQLQIDPLMSNRELAARANLKLGRKDLTEINVDAALAQISAKSLRTIIRPQMEKGNIRYRENYLLAKSFSALQSQDSILKQEALTLLARAEIEPGDNKDEEGVIAAQVPESMLNSLCTPDHKLESMPTKLILMVISLRLYGQGLALKGLGELMGVDKTTVLRWIIGLAIGLYPILMGWINQRVKGGIVYLDEKWIKIKGEWHYWFVALDSQTRLPIVAELMPGKSKWYCQWILLRLKQIEYRAKVIITDGLTGYGTAIAQVFKGAIHQLCVFHHQQNVTKFVRENFSDEQERAERKKELKAVFQTKDKRTVRNRLAKLALKAEKLGITTWIKSVIEHLPQLLPAIGSRRIPSTSNAIERFFRAFNQFYKRRNGFFSVTSAKHQLMLFCVFHLFTRGEDGVAPIERIMPEASRMPLYKLMNEPLISLGIWRQGVEQNQAIANSQLKQVA